MKLYLSSYRIQDNAPEFINLLAGGRCRVAFIPNALDGPANANRRDACIEEDIAHLRQLGLSVSNLDLRDYFGKTEKLSSALDEFDCLFVRGGNSFVLRRAYRESGLDKILPTLIVNNNIVYAAYSAGIDPLTPTLHGAEMVDDPTDVPDGYPVPAVWDGLALLPYVVAPHFRSDHPESRAIDDVIDYLIDHHTPFIALRDGEAIVVDGALADQRISRVA